ncbi:hypothetical protein Purlil1_4531 [Purpureocillium lilacinum]|uniref:Uncharacterized protein n=1 Tax=Purpureocillium lilacinum TaxID=33203 RepID=A0ABR0C4D5_PURLI|nr:hypothetical protein Purlil1_4531 [Purpureocillium lilacinum]
MTPKRASVHVIVLEGYCLFDHTCAAGRAPRDNRLNPVGPNRFNVAHDADRVWLNLLRREKPPLALATPPAVFWTERQPAAPSIVEAIGRSDPSGRDGGVRNTGNDQRPGLMHGTESIQHSLIGWLSQGRPSTHTSLQASPQLSVASDGVPRKSIDNLLPSLRRGIVCANFRLRIAPSATFRKPPSGSFSFSPDSLCCAWWRDLLTRGGQTPGRQARDARPLAAGLT